MCCSNWPLAIRGRFSGRRPSPEAAADVTREPVTSIFPGSHGSLRERDCDLVQGFWLGYPLEPQQFVDLLG